MAVKLRLMRVGKKKQPSYRIVAADSHSPRDGRFIEIVGTYAPRAEPSVINLDNDKAIAWLNKGAQPTETVRKLLEISGAWETFSAAHPKSTVAAKKPATAKAGAKAPAKVVAKAPTKAAVETSSEASGEESADAPAEVSAEAAGE